MHKHTHMCVQRDVHTYRQTHAHTHTHKDKDAKLL